jgi:hypothetical protein
MDNLNIDIVYEICKYLSIKDISHLQIVSVNLYNNIKLLHSNILIRELKDLHIGKKNMILLKYNFYEYLIYFLKSNVLEYTKLKNVIIYRMYNRIRNFLIYNLDNSLEDKNVFVEFPGTAWEYISKLETYPNKLELLVLYNFINIECFINYNIDYSFKFLNILDTKKKIIHDDFYDVKYKYYKNILYIEKYDIYYMNFSFDKLYQMVPYITSVYILKRLFGFKILDLTYTTLFPCCEDCIIHNLHYICDLKMNFYLDDLICHNYSEILKFLYRENRIYYNILINREKYLINNKIYITNPKTNRNIKISDKYFKRLQNELNDMNLTRIIHNKRKKLIQKYFR